MWWLEQVAHFLIGGGISYAFAFDWPWLVGFPVSVLGGIIRELVQNLRFKGWRPYWDGSKEDAGVDMLAWIVGAAIGSLIA